MCGISRAQRTGSHTDSSLWKVRMTQWTNSYKRPTSTAAFLTVGLMLAITHGTVDGAQYSLLPPPPIPSYVPSDQARPSHNVTSAHNSLSTHNFPSAHNPPLSHRTLPAENHSMPATRQVPMIPMAPRATNNNTLPSFPIHPRGNRGPSRVVADTSVSLSTKPDRRPGAVGPVRSNPNAVPSNPNTGGPIGSMRIAGNDTTAMPNIHQQPPTLLRVPREIQLRAHKMLKAGKRLAERGALYSARQEFLGVLQLVAQSHDAQLGKRFHTRALANGLRALREADDFVAYRTDHDVDLQLEGLVAGHQTTVLKNTRVKDLTPFVAMQRYYEYASDQLAIAANREPVASEALYAIGRAETAMAAKSQAKLGGPKPLALYQASLVVDESNSAASNELGVLLARAGKLEQAASVLQHASSIRSTPELVNNLNAVNRRLHGGEAFPQYDSAPNHMTPEMLAKRVQVQWMTPEEYSQQIGPAAPMMSNHVNRSRDVRPYNSLPAPNQQRFPMMTR